LAGIRSWAPTALLASLAAVCFLLPVSNPDLFWHISAARWIVEHGAFPRADWLSFTMDGKPWADFEWLSQLAFNAVFAPWGGRGLWALKVLLFGAGGLLFWRCLGLYGPSPSARAVGLLAWALGLSTANDLRPEIFSLLFFLALWRELEAWRLGLRHRLSAGMFAGVFALWANLHAGFVYGLVLTGIFAAASALRRKGSEAWLWLAAGAGSALINPYGWGIYGVLWEHWSSLGQMKEYIREWQEASVESFWLWPFWTILAASFASALARFLKSRDVPYEHLAALFFFGLSASGQVRTTVYFVSAALPVAACAMSGLFRDGPRGRLLLLAAAAEIAFFSLKIVPQFEGREFISPRFVPVQATRFLKDEQAHLGGRRIFNPWHWGGFLGMKLHPAYRIFVDGRYIFHPLLEPMYSASRSPEEYQAFLGRYGIGIAMLERTHQLRQVQAILKGGEKAVLWRPFYVYFLPKRDWALVHWDDQAMVFVRRDAVASEWLQSHEFKAFRPDDLIAARLMVSEGHMSIRELASEVERFRKTASEAESRAAADFLAQASN
jgi:hypothetical protein